jgi:hypothetical protein
MFIKMENLTITLFRPVNDKELELIKESGWKKFPLRLPQQPIFYPVMNEEYAIQIAKDWNVPAYGVGYVLKFEMNKAYIDTFEIQNVGGMIHNELWILSEELETFNDNIVGVIEIIREYR